MFIILANIRLMSVGDMFVRQKRGQPSSPDRHDSTTIQVFQRSARAAELLVFLTNFGGPPNPAGLLHAQAPERFVKVCAKIPSGVLLTGPPGTGQTLMAKALLGSVNGAVLFGCQHGSEEMGREELRSAGNDPEEASFPRGVPWITETSSV